MGRLRAFEEQDALDAITREFWLRGYLGTTICYLEMATGVAKPSLYRAFGNKQRIFERAVDHFIDRYLAFFGGALGAPTAREAVERLRSGVINLVASGQTPRGSLITHGLTACAPEDEQIRQRLVQGQHQFERAIKERLTQAREQGELPDGFDCDGLSKYLICLFNGIALQALCGTPASDFTAISAFALSAFPDCEAPD